MLRERGEVDLERKTLYTGHLFFGRQEFKHLYDHCYTGLEVDVAKHLHTLLPKLSNGVYDYINMSRPNYKRKMQEDGILHFVAYEIFYKGEAFVLKRRVKRIGRRVCEYPYSIKQKE